MPDHSIDEALSRLHQTAVPESYQTGWRAAVRREECLHMNHEKRTALKRLWRTAMPALCALVLVVGGLWAGENPSPIGMNDTVVMNSRTLSSASYDYAAETSYDGGAVMTKGAGVSSPAAPQAQETRKLVRSASITLRTAAFDDVLEQLNALLSDVGGYVQDLYQYGDTTRRINLGLRVPAEKLDAFLSGASGLGRVSDRSESTVDMTTVYVDNQARLSTLYAKRDRLNELLLKAEDVSDLIEIESAIADTQYQIDSYESSQRTIDSEVNMSAVQLTLMEETSSSTAMADVSLGQRIRAAFRASVQWMGELARNIVVFIVIILPAALPVSLIVLAVRLVRRFKHHKEV